MYISKTKPYVALIAFVLILGGCAAERTRPPPEGMPAETPWGATSVESWDSVVEDVLGEEAVREIHNYITDHREHRPGEKILYQMLALSGGGSRGAYGAGVLSAWTKMGGRPEFAVVTGISTGALMATAAFLGPEYDEALAVYTQVSNEDLVKPLGKFAFLKKESMYSTAPLRALLDQQISDEMIEAVAAQHRLGRRLFIGTTNLDANMFTIWDMGRIAASDRPGKQDLYRDVILASASFPVAFPPVYIPVTNAQGKTYDQMHVDGGMKETVMVYDYLSEVQAIVKQSGLDWDKDVQTELYILANTQLIDTKTYKATPPTALSIGWSSVMSLLRKNTVSSVYVAWSQGLAHGANVYLAAIPEEYDLQMEALDFDPAGMKKLYDFGYRQMMQNEAWHAQKAPESLEEMKALLNIYYQFVPIDPDIEHRDDPEWLDAEN